jgi:2,3-dihydroxybiphenyl 1,2-dioxygenase
MRAEEPPRWGAFAADLFGAQCQTEPDGCIAVRLDEQAARIRVLPGANGEMVAMGWQARDAGEWRALAEQLERGGARLQVVEAQASQGFGQVAAGSDPFGNAFEICCEPVSTPGPVPAGAPRAQLGHVVLGVPDLESAEAFYVGALGLRVTDRIMFEKAGRTIDICFLRAGDGRHHSLALVAGTAGINHLMVEVTGVDTVGRCLDRCRSRGDAVRRELGRHSNDQMFSFYAQSPNGVDIEIGCDGIAVHDASWVVKSYRSTSSWGHRLV